ncbi:peptidase S41 [Marivirga tractuosa]|uniref:Peptidase S41 n=1 Tax=Marivirga tractuosa (strain ATCC 23168 / DSM 4126 / NBRC 15989 / NCIMB 1408 / VKM B-1430 / H-43) TaxID=643867 RepID=E4TV48_MARTH|nr:S41 family peptidase [Marivirga tractuosa]ADR22141.1 peptidase S41 [Marivirga tractuosa DSM 4126]BDD13397.1 peptidase S41 [Marivirga tractuosa]
MKQKHILILLIISLGFSSCERLFMKEETEPENAVIFDHLWETVDEKYSFFIDKSIDWDSARDVFRPKAVKARNSIELFNVLADMLFILKDGHVNISAGIDLSRNWDWFLKYPSNFNFDVIERNYLVPSKDYQISGPIHNTIIDSVGYMYYESFSDNVSTSLMDYLVFKFLINEREGSFELNSLKGPVAGLIIDVRNNGGGSISNAFTIANRFADEKIKVADWFYKIGPEHDEFSQAEEKFLEFEGDEEYKFDKPIVVLVNRSSYSSANFFASMMSFLPNVTIMGDQTGGGGGLPINNELPNGWRYRFSSTRTLDANGNNIEFGVKPEIAVELDSADLAGGKDRMIEEAINFIKDQ